MKKYITTDKHPELKEGIEFIPHLMGQWITPLQWATLTESEIGAELTNGNIKEIQEPKWTDDDMIIFANLHLQHFRERGPREELEDFKQRKP